MERLYKKNELTFSLAWIAAYVVLFSAADQLSEALGVAKCITAPIGMLLVGSLFMFMKKHGLMDKYGLCAFRGSAKDYLYFVPLALLLTVNLWNGVALNASVPETVLYIVSMLCVGLIEEVIFRGLLFKALCKDNVKLAVMISSLTFGMGHIVNLLNGQAVLPTLLQIGYAAAIGFLFTIIFCKSGSLRPCMLVHGVFNALSIFAADQPSPTAAMITAAALCLWCIGYALWIVKKVPAEDAGAFLHE